jgi:Polyketide cyclase / dehydrase and lipid transport
MKIEKSIEINRKDTEVFDYLKLTKNQDNFSVWNMADPGMKKEYRGSDGNVGFVYAWDSKNKNVGAGEQETKELVKSKSIRFEVRFFRPMQNTGTATFYLNKKSENLTEVSWIFDSPSKFPYSLFAPFFKKMMGRDLEKGLDNLKNILENKNS